MTQENTAASEQLSATAEELASQADQLKSAIAFFKVDAGATTPLRRARPAAKASKPLAKPAKSGGTPYATAAAPKAMSEDAGGGFNFDLTTEDDLDAEFASAADKKGRAA